MSRPEQRQRDEQREAEEARYGLSWYEKVEEAESIGDIKRLLHEIAEKIEGFEL